MGRHLQFFGDFYEIRVFNRNSKTVISVKTDLNLYNYIILIIDQRIIKKILFTLHIIQRMLRS